MYIMIEHNGSEDHVKYMKELRDHLESEWGATVEDIVGRYDNKIQLYSENLETIVLTDPDTSLEIINYYIAQYYDNE